jgi:hypothetical protein
MEDRQQSAVKGKKGVLPLGLGPQCSRRAISKLENIGQLNPEWIEWFMGWPMGWTELEPLGTDKFQEWQQLHGLF